MDKSKSILDNVPINDMAFPLNKKELKIVGHCPLCGSPIYGPTTALESEYCVQVRRSCTCNQSIVGQTRQS